MLKILISINLLHICTRQRCVVSAAILSYVFDGVSSHIFMNCCGCDFLYIILLWICHQMVIDKYSLDAWSSVSVCKSRNPISSDNDLRPVIDKHQEAGKQTIVGRGAIHWIKRQRVIHSNTNDRTRQHSDRTQRRDPRMNSPLNKEAPASEGLSNNPTPYFFHVNLKK